MDIIEDAVITSQPKVTPEQCIPTLDPPRKRDRIEDCCTCYCCLGPTPDWARSHSSLSSASGRRGSCDNDDNGNITTTMLNDIQATPESDKSNGLDCNRWSKHDDDHGHDYGSHDHNGHDTWGGGCDSGGGDSGGGDCGGGDCGGGD